MLENSHSFVDASTILQNWSGDDAEAKASNASLTPALVAARWLAKHKPPARLPPPLPSGKSASALRSPSKQPALSRAEQEAAEAEAEATRAREAAEGRAEFEWMLSERNEQEWAASASPLTLPPRSREQAEALCRENPAHEEATAALRDWYDSAVEAPPAEPDAAPGASEPVDGSEPGDGSEAAKGGGHGSGVTLQQAGRAVQMAIRLERAARFKVEREAAPPAATEQREEPPTERDAALPPLARLVSF